MRVSAVPGSAFFQADLIGRIKVFCDGQEISDVREASARGGWVVRFLRDENGALVVVGDDYAMETLFGAVRIHVAPDPAPEKPARPRRKKSVSKDIDA